jgi:prolyl-tRNA editing enzyme YbaK/EbsC (Cys-tRNA(Pro) deacylase)
VPEGTIDNHPAVDRVRSALGTANMDATIVALPDAARTARSAANAIGCDVAQIANSLVFRGRVTGAALVGEPVGKADPAFVRAATGFVIGGVAPVGHVAPMRTLIDRDLFRHAEIWAAAGHPRTVFRLTPDALVRLTGGTVAEVT